MDDVVGIDGVAARAGRRTRELRVPAAAGAVAVATGVAGFLSVIGADSRWLGAMGAAIVRAGHIPRGVPFAVVPSAHWPNVPVLAELLSHALLGMGLRGLLVAQLVAVAVALSAVAVDARALGARDGQAAGAVLIAAVAALPELAIVRSQLFSLALFPVLMLLLRAETRRPSRRLWLVLPLLALWSNLHGAVLVGLALLLVYLAVFRLRRRPLETVAVGASACLACCLTPALWRTPLYFRGVLENEAARRGVGLWAPLTIHKPFDVVLAAGAIVLLVLALRGGADLWEWAAFVALVAVTIMASRDGIWLVLALAPRAARGLPQGAFSSRLAAAAVAVGAAAALLSVAQGPGSPGAGAALVERTVRAAHGAPVLAEDTLAEQVALAGGHIWIGNPLDAFPAAPSRRISTGSREAQAATPMSRGWISSSSSRAAEPSGASLGTRHSCGRQPTVTRRCSRGAFTDHRVGRPNRLADARLARKWQIVITRRSNTAAPRRHTRGGAHSKRVYKGDRHRAPARARRGRPGARRVLAHPPADRPGVCRRASADGPRGDEHPRPAFARPVTRNLRRISSVRGVIGSRASACARVKVEHTNGWVVLSLPPGKVLGGGHKHGLRLGREAGSRFGTSERSKGGNMFQAIHARLFIAYADLRSRDQEGQALVEYALIISLIALVAFGALQLTGTSIKTIFTGISNDL